MKKSFLLPFLLFCFYSSSAQEVYFSHGKNITQFESLNTTVNQLPLEKGIGNSFEIGFKSNYINETSFFYTLGFAYNQFNGLGKTDGLNMEWNTNYVGLNSTFNYSFIKSNRNTVSFKLGTSMQTIVYGKQEINQVQLDIVNNREFSGFNLGLQSGLVYDYKINSDFSVNAGYTYVHLFNLSENMPEKAFIANQNWSVGFSIAIK